MVAVNLWEKLRSQLKSPRRHLPNWSRLRHFGSKAFCSRIDCLKASPGALLTTGLAFATVAGWLVLSKCSSRDSVATHVDAGRKDNEEPDHAAPSLHDQSGADVSEEAGALESSTVQGSDTGTTPPRRPMDSQGKPERLSPGNQPETPEEEAINTGISSDSVASMIRDCPRQIKPSCSVILPLVREIEVAPDDLEDGWSEWMEVQIEQALVSAAGTHSFSEIGVKCTAHGCLFSVTARSGGEVFGIRGRGAFEHWFTKQPWIDEFQPHERPDGSHSVLAWQVSEVDAYRKAWYVIERRD